MLRKSESADQQEEDGGSKGRGRGLGGEKSRGGGARRRSCPPSEGASKGNFTKADPLVMNVI